MAIHTTHTYCPCIKTIDGLQPVQTSALPEDGILLTFQASPGLYQLSVVADAQEFDWNELYIELNEFQNVRERTGPWDFNLQDANRPLVPSYWVALDGQRIGLWYFSRVTLEDIAAKRFRGRMACWIQQEGEHTLELQPYRPLALHWQSAVLEVDPDDTLAPLKLNPDDWSTRCPAAQYADPAFWAVMREKLATTHAMYQEPLRRAFGWLRKRTEFKAHDLPLLQAAYYLDGWEDARDIAMQAIDQAIALPHWGNRREDGYGHNGDMGAMELLRVLAWAYHALGDKMGEERRVHLRDKLQLQGNRFVEMALLMRDYWGGSVLQDHGWKSLFGFGAAALYLLGVIPEAARWTAFAIPRLRRSLAGIPRDGVIPQTSYAQLYLYLDEPMHYREALLALTGEDILDTAPFSPVIDYLLNVVREQDHLMVIDAAYPFVGGNLFLNRMASKYRDGRAAYLQQRLLETPEFGFFHPTQEAGYYFDALEGFFSYDPAIPPAQQLPPPRALAYYPDSGLVNYRDPVDDVTFTLRCGPISGYHAFHSSNNPCDRLGLVPGSGHFTLAVGAEHLLTTPDSGYKLATTLRSCLLIDGQGQYGDIGYPMSIPSKRDRGEEIVVARWEEATQCGLVRLDLTAAYPDALGVALYTRDFLLYPGCKIVCRDRVVLDAPRQFSWLFQGKRELGVAVDGLCGIFGSNAAVRVTPQPVDFSLTAGVYPTPVVWAYASTSGFKPFDHVRYDTAEPVATALVDFVLTWK
ncbi:MAG: hypothetical protein ACYDBB_18730 [Armatimonadota bacterium]